MNVSNLENSKRLYELSGWYGNYIYQNTGTEAEPFIELRKFSYSSFVGKEGVIAPAYDAGFLLRKLPRYDISFNGVLHTVTFWDDDTDKEFVGEGATVEDALCLLAIKLLEEKII